MANPETDERYSRQRDIVPPDRLRACQATVIGVGAIGRQVALQLAAMGAPQLQLVDHDTVEESNLASQGYLETDLGRPKVEATGELCRRINSELGLVAEPGRFRRSMAVGNAVFACVDSIDTRRLIWQAVQDKVDFFVDGRMTAEVLRVIAAHDAASREHYPTTLFAAQEAHAGACTAKTTIYCANVAAGFMLAQFGKWLRGLPVELDVYVNLLGMEMASRDSAGVQPAGGGAVGPHRVDRVQCEGCDGSGVRAPASPSCPFDPAARSPWAVVERCDTCERFPDDQTAARAIFTRVREQLCLNDGSHILADLTSRRRG